jgi:hypothetical protein
VAHPTMRTSVPKFEPRNEELLSGVNFYGVKLRGVVGQKIARLHPGWVERAYPARRECRCSEPDASH